MATRFGRKLRKERFVVSNKEGAGVQEKKT